MYSVPFSHEIFIKIELPLFHCYCFTCTIILKLTFYNDKLSGRFQTTFLFFCYSLRRSHHRSPEVHQVKRSLCFWLLLRKPWLRYWLSGNNHNHERVELQLSLLPMAPVTSRDGTISENIYFFDSTNAIYHIIKITIFLLLKNIRNIYVGDKNCS